MVFKFFFQSQRENTFSVEHNQISLATPNI